MAGRKAARGQPADIDASTAVASAGAASSSRSSSDARAAATGPSTRSVENRVDSGAPQASRPTVSATPSATLRQNATSNDQLGTIKATSAGAASSSRSSSDVLAAARPSTRSIENDVDSGAPQASRPTDSAIPPATPRENASSNDLRATIKAALDATATYSMYQGMGRDGRCLDTPGFLRDSCFDIDGSGALCAPQEGLSIAEQSRIGQASIPRVLTGSEAALSNLAKFGQPLPQPGYADAGLDLRQARALAETVLSGNALLYARPSDDGRIEQCEAPQGTLSVFNITSLDLRTQDHRTSSASSDFALGHLQSQDGHPTADALATAFTCVLSDAAVRGVQALIVGPIAAGAAPASAPGEETGANAWGQGLLTALRQRSPARVTPSIIAPLDMLPSETIRTQLSEQGIVSSCQKDLIALTVGLHSRKVKVGLVNATDPAVTGGAIVPGHRAHISDHSFEDALGRVAHIQATAAGLAPTATQVISVASQGVRTNRGSLAQYVQREPRQPQPSRPASEQAPDVRGPSTKGLAR